MEWKGETEKMNELTAAWNLNLTNTVEAHSTKSAIEVSHQLPQIVKRPCPLTTAIQSVFFPFRQHLKTFLFDCSALLLGCVVYNENSFIYLYEHCGCDSYGQHSRQGWSCTAVIIEIWSMASLLVELTSSLLSCLTDDCVMCLTSAAALVSYVTGYSDHSTTIDGTRWFMCTAASVTV